MARPKKHNLTCSYLLCFIILFSLAAAVSAISDDSTLCTLPSPKPKHVSTDGKDAFALLQQFQLSAGYFVGGEELHFAKNESDDWSYVPRSFSVLPHSVDRTDDPSLLHVAVTLTLSGGRTRLVLGGSGRRRQSYLSSQSVSFYLSGYYTTSGELCATGAGTYTEDDGTIQDLRDVVLKLRVPNPPSLKDPFVTGILKGARFKAISLVAYAEGDNYKYGQAVAPCASPRPSSSPARGAFDAFGGTKFSCARLRQHLVSSFKLRYGGNAHATLPMLQGLQDPRMDVGEVQCTVDGAVRAYVAFSNNTKQRWGRFAQRPSFTVTEEAVVAEGRWDSTRNMLCLRACRVVRSKSMTSLLTVRPQECGVGMSFWFPAVWTIHDRSVVSGTIWNLSHHVTASDTAAGGAVSASSVDMDVHRGNFSDIEYSYNHTIVEKAKEQYLLSKLSKCNTKKKTKEPSLISANYTYRDFEFRFYENKEMGYGRGNAYPVAIDSVMVYGDRLAADDYFARSYNDTMVEKAKDQYVRSELSTYNNELLNVSYEIQHSFPPADWVRPNTSSYAIPIEDHLITAEGVYDPKTGVLCLIGCREVNASTDCEMLITVQFNPLDAKKAQGHGQGAMSSLRDKNDRLYFEKIEIRLYGMYNGEIAESISRMDMESVLLLLSTTLPCVFTVLQILHAKRRPDASAATSITMLMVVALGYVAPLLVTSSDTLFMSRRTTWVPFQSYVPYELNQAMLRAPTLIALLLQLRLIQLAWSARKSSAVAADQNKAAAADTWSAAERRSLVWVCLPLYLAGAALTVVVNVVNARRAQDSLTVNVGPPPATLWQDLVSSAGLALDAFLLPQVAMNVFSVAAGAGVAVGAAVSPWFYVGGTVVRAMPHVYDVVRRQGYAPSVRPSYVYAGPRDDRFGLAWDVTVPCVAGVLAVLLFMQQRRAGAFLPRSRSRKSGGYELVASI